MRTVKEQRHEQPRLLVLGVGNRYRSDDGVGLSVARRFQCEVGNEVMIREESGEGTALLDAWQDADVVILVDAVRSGREPGTIYRFDVHEQTLPEAMFRCSTHAFGVAEAVALARVLDRLPPRLIVYGVEGQTFAAGLGLSPAVEKAVEHVVARVREEIANENAATKVRHA